jgi:hypothetical protein
MSQVVRISQQAIGQVARRLTGERKCELQGGAVFLFRYAVEHTEYHREPRVALGVAWGRTRPESMTYFLECQQLVEHFLQMGKVLFFKTLRRFINVHVKSWFLTPRGLSLYTEGLCFFSVNA